VQPSERVEKQKQIE